MSLSFFQKIKNFALETLNADPGSNLFAGRLFFDGIKKLPRLYTGTEWTNIPARYVAIYTGGGTPLKKNDFIMLDSSGAGFSIDLPASPSAGDIIVVGDAQGTWSTNNVTLNRNGSNINAVAANYVLNASGKLVTLVYIDGTRGWQVFV